MYYLIMIEKNNVGSRKKYDLKVLFNMPYEKSNHMWINQGDVIIEDICKQLYNMDIYSWISLIIS